MLDKPLEGWPYGAQPLHDAGRLFVPTSERVSFFYLSCTVWDVRKGSFQRLCEMLRILLGTGGQPPSVTRRRAGLEGAPGAFTTRPKPRDRGICRATRLRHRLARSRPRGCTEIQGCEPFHRILVVRFSTSCPSSLSASSQALSPAPGRCLHRRLPLARTARPGRRGPARSWAHERPGPVPVSRMLRCRRAAGRCMPMRTAPDVGSLVPFPTQPDASHGCCVWFRYVVLCTVGGHLGLLSNQLLLDSPSQSGTSSRGSICRPSAARRPGACPIGFTSFWQDPIRCHSVAISMSDCGVFRGFLRCPARRENACETSEVFEFLLVTPAGFEPAISTLKGSRPWPRLDDGGP